MVESAGGVGEGRIDMGEKIGVFGINWGEIALRSLMTIVTSLMSCLFFVMILDVFSDSKRYG